MALVLSTFTKRGSREFSSHTTIGQCHVTKAVRTEKPLEELYHVQVERKLAELGISRWSTGKFKLPWDWHVDRLVYIEEGEVRVVPEGNEHFMTWFVPLNGSRIISSEDH